jgi:hypothetical protein
MQSAKQTSHNVVEETVKSDVMEFATIIFRKKICGHPKWTHPVDAVPGLHGVALVELLSCTLDGGTVSRDFWDILKEGRILNFII